MLGAGAKDIHNGACPALPHLAWFFVCAHAFVARQNLLPNHVVPNYLVLTVVLILGCLPPPMLA